MFRRRRHAAAAPAAPAPQLTDEQIFEQVHAVLDHVLGENGTWTVTLRDDADTDSFFHRLLAHSIAQDITTTLSEAKGRLSAEQREALHAATEPQRAAVTPADEPAALTWQPAPITLWTDLKRPVTGETPTVHPTQLVA